MGTLWMKRPSVTGTCTIHGHTQGLKLVFSSTIIRKSQKQWDTGNPSWPNTYYHQLIFVEHSFWSLYTDCVSGTVVSLLRRSGNGNNQIIEVFWSWFCPLNLLLILEMNSLELVGYHQNKWAMNQFRTAFGNCSKHGRWFPRVLSIIDEPFMDHHWPVATISNNFSSSNINHW